MNTTTFAMSDFSYQCSSGFCYKSHPDGGRIDRFADMVAILISILSKSYYGMLWGQIHIHLPPEHPIRSFETIEIKMVTISAKPSMQLHSLIFWSVSTLLLAIKGFETLPKSLLKHLYLKSIALNFEDFNRTCNECATDARTLFQQND